MHARGTRVFISANSSEFKHLRNVATNELLIRECTPVAMDHFPVHAGNLVDFLKTKIAECDMVLCLVGTGFGAAAPTPAGHVARSYTQLEFDLARKLRKPTFIFMKEVGAGEEVHPDQERFRQEIRRSGLVWHKFATEEDFRRCVLRMDASKPRGSWTRAILTTGAVLLMVAVGLPLLGKKNVVPEPTPPPDTLISTITKPSVAPMAIVAPVEKPAEEFPPPKTEPPQAPLVPNAGSARQAGQIVPVMLAPGIVKEFVWCPPGSFTMGFRVGEAGSSREDREEAKPEQVTIQQGFWMARQEVTRQEANAFAAKSQMSIGDVAHTEGEAELPLTGVSWDDANLLARWLTKQRTDGTMVGLPTEAEWEYAARAGTTTPYSFGNELDGTQANCDGWKHPFSAIRDTIDPGRSLGRAVAVGSYKPNAWEIYDMHGNVREWCQDAYPKQGGAAFSGLQYGIQRVLKGGYWSSAARSCRSGSRDHAISNKAVEGAGIRLVIRSAGRE